MIFRKTVHGVFSWTGAVIIDTRLAEDLEELKKDFGSRGTGFDSTVRWAGSQYESVEAKVPFGLEYLSKVAIPLVVTLAFPYQVSGVNIAYTGAASGI